MVSPDAASEIACPMVAQAVAFVLQLLPSSPLTPSTYHVPASAGEDSMIRATRTGTTRPFSMVTPPSKYLLATIAHDLIRHSPDSQRNGARIVGKLCRAIQNRVRGHDGPLRFQGIRDSRSLPETQIDGFGSLQSLRDEALSEGEKRWR